MGNTRADSETFSVPGSDEFRDSRDVAGSRVLDLYPEEAIRTASATPHHFHNDNSQYSPADTERPYSPATSVASCMQTSCSKNDFANGTSTQLELFRTGGAPPNIETANRMSWDVDYPESNLYMCEKQVRNICLKRGLYNTPYLNEKLLLHAIGFSDIQGLENYTEVRALVLEANAIRRIEGISHMSHLKSLYLGNNCIEKIEGLSGCPNLLVLNLAHNRIQIIENLKSLTKLQQLNLAFNIVDSFSSLGTLEENKDLTSIDLSGNVLDIRDESPSGPQQSPKVSTLGGPGRAEMEGQFELMYEKILSKWEKVSCVYFSGNPFVRRMSNYRKKVVCALPKLTFLDDRPVSTNERWLALAWQKGGKTAEKTESIRIAEEAREASSKLTADFREMQAKHRQNTRLALARIEKHPEDSVEDSP